MKSNLRRGLVLTAAAVILVITSSCMFFSPTGVYVTNNTGAPVTVNTDRVDTYSETVFATVTIADGATELIDVASEIPILGGNVIPEFYLLIEGKYFFGSETFTLAEYGTTASDIDIDANAASVTLTNSTSNTYTKLALDDAVTIGIFDTTVYGDVISTETFAPSDEIVIPVPADQDVLNCYYSSGILGRSGGLGISTSDIGTDIGRSIN